MMVIGVAHHTELAVTADFLLYNHIALPCDSTYDGDHLRRLALCIASIYLRSALRRVASVCILLVACVRRAVCSLRLSDVRVYARPRVRTSGRVA